MRQHAADYTPPQDLRQEDFRLYARSSVVEARAAAERARSFTILHIRVQGSHSGLPRHPIVASATRGAYDARAGDPDREALASAYFGDPQYALRDEASGACHALLDTPNFR